jgi:penicillin-binding protein 1A
MKSGEGAAMALPIFGLFMQKVYADPRINLYKGPFPVPENYDVPFDCSMREVEETDTKGSREDSF